MRVFLSFIFSALILVSWASADDPLQSECASPAGSEDISRQIEQWLESSFFDRSGIQYDELQAVLERGDHSCGDKIALQTASKLLDLRRHASDTAADSALYIINNSEHYDPVAKGSAVRTLIAHYKTNQQFEHLIALSRQPVVTEQAYTLVAARDAYLLSLVALGQEEAALELMRPLAEQPMNGQDWWFLNFGSALAQRLNDADLAAAFQRRADKLFKPRLEFDFREGLEGDRLTKMITQETVAVEQQAWEVIKAPKPKYPRRALNRMKSGFCNVQFDISSEGAPINVKAFCSDDVFVRESEKAIQNARMRILDPNPQMVLGVSYPLEYSVGRSTRRR